MSVTFLIYLFLFVIHASSIYLILGFRPGASTRAGLREQARDPGTNISITSECERVLQG